LVPLVDLPHSSSDMNERPELESHQAAADVCKWVNRDTAKARRSFVRGKRTSGTVPRRRSM
jgi:hypothetical protein